MTVPDATLASYLDEFEKDWIHRNRPREWSHRGVAIRLFPNVFPSDSPYTLTTASMLDSLARDSRALGSEHYATILDVGTGNGAFAIFIGMLAPRSRVVAIDNDVAALAAAQWNARRSAAHNVSVVGSDLFASLGIRVKVDLAVAALPFAQELRGEGLLERFWAGASRHLRTGARVYFSWAEWVDYARLETVASAEGFSVVRVDEYALHRSEAKFGWRVYVFEASRSARQVAGNAHGDP